MFQLRLSVAYKLLPTHPLRRQKCVCPKIPKPQLMSLNIHPNYHVGVYQSITLYGAQSETRTIEALGSQQLHRVQIVICNKTIHKQNQSTSLIYISTSVGPPLRPQPSSICGLGSNTFTSSSLTNCYSHPLCSHGSYQHAMQTTHYKSLPKHQLRPPTPSPQIDESKHTRHVHRAHTSETQFNSNPAKDFNYHPQSPRD